jgi:Flp pilus assembly protein TadG
MSAWDVQPDGVQGVLTQAEGALNDLLTQGQAIETALTAAGAAAMSAAVTGAVDGFNAVRVGPTVQAAVDRGSRCGNAAWTATQAYLQGQLEMAANAQACASAAPDPSASMPGLGRGGR